MDTASLKPFAQQARRHLLDQVGARLEQVLRTDSVELREKKQTLEKLREQIDQTSKKAVVDRVAYTWFNRFCALRFMDVNHYTRVGIVSPAEGRTLPEILQDAKQGLVDDSLKVDRERVLDLLRGNAVSSNPQQEAYRLMLVGACNAYHDQMPFLFEAIEDFTELLMPDDLLSENSVLQAVRDALTPEACQDVEVIGWLYQYYISERKDEVFANLKKNKKIQPEDIPAATQLFTPHWIVRYLVENSLGRLWMLNHSESMLVEQMEYYIRPEQKETDFLKIGSPEEIKVCDPACGSGHMLTYAFDLLYAIYEEQGYDPVEIPRQILENNLYGIEIDERAGHLAAFALMMKARERDGRFFTRGVEPNICVLENVAFTEEELDAYMDAVGRDLFTQDLQETLTQFEQADNFGSLIQPKAKDTTFIRQRIQEQGVFEDLFLHQTNQKVLKVLEQSEYLNPGYHVVVTNPPYINFRRMNPFLKEFIRRNYSVGRADLFSAFVLRIFELSKHKSYSGFMTPFVWMFISSYEEFRAHLIDHKTIKSLVQLEYSGFEGATVPICIFTIENWYRPEFEASYIRLSEFRGTNNQAPKTIEAIRDNSVNWMFRVPSTKFKKLPGTPIAYWATQNIVSSFQEFPSLGTVAETAVGLFTCNDKKFLRYWSEISLSKVGFGLKDRDSAEKSSFRWFPYNKGGGFRKWYGLNDLVVDFPEDGLEIRKYRKQSGQSYTLPGEKYYFRQGITWSGLTSARNSFRFSDAGFIFESNKGQMLFADADLELLGLLNSPITFTILKIINPTLSVQSNEIKKIPVAVKNHNLICTDVKELIQLSKSDWDAFENSWDFEGCPLLFSTRRKHNLSGAYETLRSRWKEMIMRMQSLENEVNGELIEIYQLQDELETQVPLNEVSLTSNPLFRYSDSERKKLSIEEREIMLLSDTMKEFISYAVGCMFGRYSLDKPGLILANEGETAEDYRKQVPDPTFAPDEDNVIPILDEGWFTDDIAERFKQFLQMTFGTENYEENLAFLENAIGKNIRSYFLKSFYGEHVKMYKKRPIYWLFSSPNGSFNALIYMHRYRSDTISIILNDYLRQFHKKLRAHRERLEQVSINPSAGRGEKTKALKESDKISKILTELKVYEDEILYPLAAKQVEIDLDDGVKVNYKKFGKALKHVSGLSQ